MTDQPNPTTDLAVIREQLTALGDGRETLDEVAQSLNTLWAEAETAQDEVRLTVISAAWQQAQSLATVAENAVIAAQTAIQMVEQVAAQRDSMAKEYTGLIEAISSVDYDHPIVSELYDLVQEDVWDNVAQSECYVSECPACDMTENHSNEYVSGNLTHDVAGLFFDLVMNDHDEQLNDDLAKELVDFIVQFVRKVADSQKAQAS